MFIDLPDQVEHQDPWVYSTETRYQKLIRGAFRIAYFYERPDNSTFRYRVHNMIETIDALWPEASAAYFSLADAAFLDKVADAADLVVICRARYSDTVNRFVRRVKRRHVPVVFDVDDLVFDTRYTHLVMHSLAQTGDTDHDWDFWFAYMGRIGATLRLCDRAITTNQHLAARIADFAGVPVTVIPNFMNDAQLSHSRAILEAKKTSGFARDEHLHIGYFSGSPTHKKDFAIAESALAKILDRYAEVRVRMVGYLEPAGRLLAYPNRIDHEPFRDYVNLQGLIGSTEINIAPLQDNLFTNCKSELKYFEAAIVGTATIASPTYTFADAIQPGVNGRLAAAHQWDDAITQTIEELRDGSAAYEAMADRAALDAGQRYGWTNQIDVIKQALT